MKLRRQFSVPRPSSEARRCSASEIGGHITPEWMLHSNLRLLCGNHHGMSSLQPLDAKNVAFSGCYAGTTMESSGRVAPVSVIFPTTMGVPPVARSWGPGMDVGCPRCL
jgi:hypothetical protein